jgi:hypothetical protein
MYRPKSKLLAAFLLAAATGQTALAGTNVIYLTSLAPGVTWTVPSDWNNAANTIEVIGGGGGGGIRAVQRS